MERLRLALPVTVIAAAIAVAAVPATPPRSSPAGAGDDPRFPTPSGTTPIVVADETPRYLGEPISLSLKEADVKNAIRTFAQLTGLNIVVDPEVRGTVTVELRDVPWDQAFELILTINDLDYQMLDNVVYVAPAAKLARHPLYTIKR